jgi:hypothetical protein
MRRPNACVSDEMLVCGAWRVRHVIGDAREEQTPEATHTTHGRTHNTWANTWVHTHLHMSTHMR